MIRTHICINKLPAQPSIWIWNRLAGAYGIHLPLKTGLYLPRESLRVECSIDTTEHRHHGYNGRQTLVMCKEKDAKSPALWPGSGYFLDSIILSASVLALSINRFCLSS